MTNFTKLFQKDCYQHRSHNKILLMVYLILVTKYRKKLFYNNFREDLKQYIFEVCKKKH